MAEYWPRFRRAKSRRPKTLERYDTLARLYVLPRFGQRILASIDSDDVGAWLAELEEAGTGAATRAAAFRLLRSIMRGALAARHVTWNPTTGHTTPAMGTEGMRFLDAQEVHQLAEATPDRYRTLVYLLAYGGLRIGEAAGLTVEALDLLRGRVTIEQALVDVNGRVELGPVKTKGSKRTIGIPGFLREMLAAPLAAFPPAVAEVPYRVSPGRVETRRARFVFTSPNGGSLRPNNYRRRVFENAVNDVGPGESPNP